MNKNSITKLGKEILRDINNTVTALRINRLLRDENGVSQTTEESDTFKLTFCGKNQSSNIMFDTKISCSQIMDELLQNRQYNILLYDKSIFQAQFTIVDNIIIKEQLVFIKKHNKIWTTKEIDDSDILEEDWFSDNFGVPIMIRIDFDLKNHKECVHPVSHMTLSNHESCRIPLKTALSFSEFVRFILHHFYNIQLDFPTYRISSEDTITQLESNMIHLAWK